MVHDFKFFLKKNFKLIFLIFFYCFECADVKNIKKIWKKYYFNTFSNKKHFEKQSLSYSQTCYKRMIFSATISKSNNIILNVFDIVVIKKI